MRHNRSRVPRSLSPPRVAYKARPSRGLCFACQARASLASPPLALCLTLPGRLAVPCSPAGLHSRPILRLAPGPGKLLLVIMRFTAVLALLAAPAAHGLSLGPFNRNQVPNESATKEDHHRQRRRHRHRHQRHRQRHCHHRRRHQRHTSAATAPPTAPPPTPPTPPTQPTPRRRHSLGRPRAGSKAFARRNMALNRRRLRWGGG